MEHSQLTWEEVSQYEEVKGYGQQIWRDQGQYYLVADEGGIAEQRVVYELPIELFNLIQSGQKSLADVHYKLMENRWPPTEEERKLAKKEFLTKHPSSLINVPKNRELFTREELEKLIPIAEELWVKGEGKLPDDYVSPLEK